jgi:hypothetical protein
VAHDAFIKMPFDRGEKALTKLTDMQSELCEKSETNYSDLSALFINCTLKRSRDYGTVFRAR